MPAATSSTCTTLVPPVTTSTGVVLANSIKWLAVPSAVSFGPLDLTRVHRDNGHAALERVTRHELGGDIEYIARAADDGVGERRRIVAGPATRCGEMNRGVARAHAGAQGLAVPYVARDACKRQAVEALRAA